VVSRAQTNHVDFRLFFAQARFAKRKADEAARATLQLLQQQQQQQQQQRQQEKENEEAVRMASAKKRAEETQQQAGPQAQQQQEARRRGEALAKNKLNHADISASAQRLIELLKRGVNIEVAKVLFLTDILSGGSDKTLT